MVTQEELTEALTSFRLAVRTNRGYQESGEIAHPGKVADVLYATLSHLAAERAPDDADRGTTAADFLADVRMQADDHQLVPAGMVYPLLAAVEKALEGHDPIKLYAGADGCPHEEPPKPGQIPDLDLPAWDEWNDSHPHGTNADGAMSDRICMLTETGTACPACSRLVYTEWGEDDGFVSAGDCIVRPLIAKALAEGEVVS